MPEKMTITQYLSGAFFANGIRIILVFILSSYLQIMSELYRLMSSWVITILAGAISSYLLTKGKTEKHLLTGAIIGLHSYIVYVLLTFVGITNQFEEMWVFMGYLLGGFLGGRLGEKGELRVSLGFPKAPLDISNNKRDDI
jgi:putative membrane protein (TIGR04086 family)